MCFVFRVILDFGLRMMMGKSVLCGLMDLWFICLFEWDVISNHGVRLML